MENIVGIIRLIIGVVFCLYGILCIIFGFAKVGGCLMHLINLVVGPILTGLSVLLFPQIIDEVMAMDESGMLAISILIIFFVVPVLASSFGKDWLAGILNGCGFLSVGMIISGVVPSTVILGLVGIMVKLFGIVAIPLVLIMFLFA